MQEEPLPLAPQTEYLPIGLVAGATHPALWRCRHAKRVGCGSDRRGKPFASEPSKPEPEPLLDELVLDHQLDPELVPLEEAAKVELGRLADYNYLRLSPAESLIRRGRQCLLRPFDLPSCLLSFLRRAKRDLAVDRPIILSTISAFLPPVLTRSDPACPSAVFPFPFFPAAAYSAGLPKFIFARFLLVYLLRFRSDRWPFLAHPKSVPPRRKPVVFPLLAQFLANAYAPKNRRCPCSLFQPWPGARKAAMFGA